MATSESSIFSLTSEFCLAVERDGFIAATINALAEVRTKLLAGYFAVIEGRAEITPVVRTTVVDLDAAPFVPDGWTVSEHRNGGTLDLSVSMLGLCLAAAQKQGSIRGEAVLAHLADKPVLNGNVLDFLLANPHLIPEDWKGKSVFFWGTVYQRGDQGLCIRSLVWSRGRWAWDSRWFDMRWDLIDPAAVAVSSS